MKVVQLEEEKMNELIGKIDNVEQKISKLENLKATQKKWLTVKEAADYLSVTPRTMFNYMSRGRIPYSNFGGKVLFLQDHLSEFLQKHMINVRGYRNINERA